MLLLACWVLEFVSCGLTCRFLFLVWVYAFVALWCGVWHALTYFTVCGFCFVLVLLVV